MSIKACIWGVGVGTFLAFVAWASVILYVNPEESGVVGLTFFYSSLFLFLAGFFMLTIIEVKSLFSKKTELDINLIESFRQGVFVAFLLSLLLFFQERGILIWWSGLLLVAGMFIVELYFLSKK